MVLNPKRKYYDGIKKYQEENYEDLVWCEDALFLERNSRNFKARSQIINENAEALCDYLSTHPKGKGDMVSILLAIPYLSFVISIVCVLPEVCLSGTL